VTAIVSTAPAIEADEREVAYAVANVVAFGLFGMLVYPYLAHAVLPIVGDDRLVSRHGVHDTSQVVGAALTYKQVYSDDIVLRVATVTKLTRNIFLAGVIPLLTWMHSRASRRLAMAASASCRRWFRLRDRVSRDGGRAIARRLDADRRTARRSACGAPRSGRRSPSRLAITGRRRFCWDGDGGGRLEHELRGVQGCRAEAVRVGMAGALRRRRVG
jgi:hypothetical protein